MSRVLASLAFTLSALLIVPVAHAAPDEGPTVTFTTPNVALYKDNECFARLVSKPATQLPQLHFASESGGCLTLFDADKKAYYVTKSSTQPLPTCPPGMRMAADPQASFTAGSKGASACAR
jgi:hypothetical protein